MASLPAFGSSGPYRDYRAYGTNIEATVGHILLRGYTDTDPSATTGVNLSDAGAGAAAAFAMMAALRHRIRTGRGQFIDLSQAENFVHSLSQAVMDYSMNGRVQSTIGNRSPDRAPQGVYRCAGEDAWVAVSCGSDAEFRDLCSVIGRPELADEPRFAGLDARQANHDELDAIVEAWTVDKDHYDVFHALQALRVPASPVLSFEEIFEDPHLQDRGDWQQVTHPEAGTYQHLRSPMHHMSATPLQIRKHAALLGADNEYVYREVCGYTDEEYRWFVENGHAGTEVVAQR
jgi:crotonobetainyl-CoA:carnitine CoA-transferase CaiB-like acyl-CoA transferase